MEQLKKLLIKIGIAAILVLGIVILTVSFVQALFSKNQNAASSAYVGAVSTGDPVRDKVWNSLRSAGYSAEATAGFMGNIEQESTFNPTLVNNIGAYGLCQWYKSRRTALQAYAADQNSTEGNVDIQIDFLLTEISGNGPAQKRIGRYWSSASQQAWMAATSPESAAEVVCNKFEVPGDNSLSKRQKYARQYYDQYTALESTSSAVLAGGFTQYYQNDYASVSYGDSTIARCGCGPTSFAMVATKLSGKAITPQTAVAWCGNAYYTKGVGTNWDYFTAAAKHFGITMPKQTKSINDVVTALKSGKVVISSQGKGLFTTGGHYIVLAGVTSDGKIIVKDPNKKNAVNKNYNNRAFTTAEINQAAKNYWIF